MLFYRNLVAVRFDFLGLLWKTSFYTGHVIRWIVLDLTCNVLSVKLNHTRYFYYCYSVLGNFNLWLLSPDIELVNVSEPAQICIDKLSLFTLCWRK